MVRYIKTIGTNIKETAELCNRNEPNLNDIERTFEDMNINMSELSDYVEQFDSKALVTDPVPYYPQPSMTRLNHLKPGSREVLHRPYHIYDYLPPIYPEMEEAENPQQSMTSLDHEMGHHIKDEIKKESSGIPAENSDLHPLREIASVMMTSSGFISPAREGRMADSRTPALSKLATNNTNLFEDDNSRPGSTDSGMKTKPKAANDTSDEGLIEDDDEVPAPIKSSGGSKLSVFQKKKNQTTKTPKAPKTPKTPKDGSGAKKSVGRPKGRKKKVDVVTPTNVVSKEFVSSSDSDAGHDLELSMTPSPPPAKKAKISHNVEPPVELKVENLALPTPDPAILPNNPLIPKFFGFENMNLDQLPKDHEDRKSLNSAPTSRPTSIEPPRIKSEIDNSDSISKQSESKSEVSSASGSVVKEAKELKKEKKKDKSLKKAKKEKKEKNREKDHKKEHKDKSEKRDKEKKKKKEKQERPPSPGLFAGTDQTIITTTSSAPKLKIKESKPEEPKLPKLVFKGLGTQPGPSQPSGTEKKKETIKQPDIFSDPIHMDRPKSAASDTSDPGKVKKIKVKEKSKEPKEDRHRSSSGPVQDQKREKRGSAIAAEAAIHATPQDQGSAGDPPSTPTFGGGSVVTQTVGYYVDAEGNQIWICPACGKPDDGSPMIGCDECDDWYHWICVGIQQEPADNQDWFCPRCVQRKSNMFIDHRKTPGKRGRPPKTK